MIKRNLRVFALLAAIWLISVLPVWAQTINFYASSTSITAGGTTTLHWYVSGVWAVHLSGEGMSETGIPGECGGGECTQSVMPNDTNGDGQVAYILRITLVGGGETTRTVNIMVDSGGGGGWVLPTLPTIPTPTEVLQEMLAFIFEPVVDTAMNWVNTLAGEVATFARVNFSVDGVGLFGQITDDLFNATFSIVAPFWVVALSVTFLQNMLERPFPGVLGRIFSVETIMVRILILLLIVPNTRQIFGTLSVIVDSLAWGLIAPASGDAWGWITLFISPLIGAISGGSLTMTIIMALLIVGLFGSFLSVVIFNNVWWVILVALFPLASIAWLTPFTESLWAKYWWLVFKLSLAPMIMALIVRISLALMGFTVAHPILGISLMLLIAGLGAGMIFKLMLAAAPLAIGGALTASGNPMGVPMMIQGASSLFGSRGSSMGRQASQAVELSRKVGGGGE